MLTRHPSAVTALSALMLLSGVLAQCVSQDFSSSTGSFDLDSVALGDTCTIRVDCVTGQCALSLSNMHKLNGELEVYDGFTDSYDSGYPDNMLFMVNRNFPDFDYPPGFVHQVVAGGSGFRLIIEAWGNDRDDAGDITEAPVMRWESMSVACGDGYRAASEACDDGNVSSGDGCASDCGSIEPGFLCPRGGGVCAAERCDDAGAVAVKEGDVLFALLDTRNTTLSDLPAFVCPEEPDDAGQAVTTRGDLWYQLLFPSTCPAATSMQLTTQIRHFSRGVVDVQEAGCVEPSVIDQLLGARVDGRCAAEASIDATNSFLVDQSLTVVSIRISTDLSVEQPDYEPSDTESIAVLVGPCVLTDLLPFPELWYAAVAAVLLLLGAIVSMTSSAVVRQAIKRGSAAPVAKAAADRATAKQDTEFHGVARLARQISALEPDATPDHHGDRVQVVVRSIGDTSTSSSVHWLHVDTTLGDAEAYFRARLPEAQGFDEDDTLDIHIAVREESWSAVLSSRDQNDNQRWSAMLADALENNSVPGVKVVAIATESWSGITALAAMADWFTDVVLFLSIATTYLSGPPHASVLLPLLLISAGSLFVSFPVGLYKARSVVRSMLADDIEFRDAVSSTAHGPVVVGFVTLLGACNLEALGILRAHVQRLGLTFRLQAASRARITGASWISTILEDIPQLGMQIWLLVLLGTPSPAQIASLVTTVVMMLVSGYRRYDTRLRIYRANQLRDLIAAPIAEDGGHVAARDEFARITNFPVSVQDVLQQAPAGVVHDDGILRVTVVAALWQPRGQYVVTSSEFDAEATMLDVQRRFLPALPVDKALTFMTASNATEANQASWTAVEGDRDYWNLRMRMCSRATRSNRLAVIISDPRQGQHTWLGLIEALVLTLFDQLLVIAPLALFLDGAPAIGWVVFVVPVLILCYSAVYLIWLRRAEGCRLRALQRFDMAAVLGAVTSPLLLCDRVLDMTRRIGPVPDDHQTVIRLRAVYRFVLVGLALARFYIAFLITIGWDHRPSLNIFIWEVVVVQGYLALRMILPGGWFLRRHRNLANYLAPRLA